MLSLCQSHTSWCLFVTSQQREDVVLEKIRSRILQLAFAKLIDTVSLINNFSFLKKCLEVFPKELAACII